MTDDLTTPLGLSCEAAFASRIEHEAVDVVEVPDDGAVEIQADEWTLHLEGDPLALVFVAIENEPDRADEFPDALRTAIAPDDLAALVALDAALDGALASRLTASGDALSAALAEMLTA
ncbi:MAG: hypothetical protein QM753_19580 [Thermomicrobiales bacterium]